MDPSTAWWVLTGLLVALELATGTFYLLMLALGAAAGALASHLGLPQAVQMGVAAVVGGAAAVTWHLRRPARAAKDPIQDLDLGQVVVVTEWGADGSARVHHRGSPWTALLQHPLPPGQSPEPGSYRISGMQGSQLLLEKA